MNCEQCQELLSEFLDNELSDAGSAEIRGHLAVCISCASVCEDLAMLVDVSRLESAEIGVPPNPQALWLRINNIIENEVRAEAAKEQKARQAAAALAPRRWSLSLTQLAAAVAGIALISSLLTFVGIRRYSEPADDLAQRPEPTIIDRVMGKLGLVETPAEQVKRKMREREAAIEYWNNRVQARRGQWDTHLREAFDRNLNEINQAVAEYTLILDENPQDALSSEMLDTALNEKMELLREFSEL